MQRTITMTFAVAGMVAAFLVTNAGEAQAQSSTPCSSRYKLAWKMPLQASDVGQRPENVLKRSEFKPERIRSLPGMSIGRAPDGTISLKVDIDQGRARKDRLNTFFLSQFGNPGTDAACLSVDVFLPSGFMWPTSGGTKMPIGLWGGSTAIDLSGGTPPNQQQGFSVRTLSNKYALRGYSYHLNRPRDYGQNSRQYGPRWGRSKWNSGKWHEIQMELVLNTPKKNDGFYQYWLDGKRFVSETNLRFRNNQNWAIRGLTAASMWQGPSPRKQSQYFANHKLYTSRGNVTAQVSNQQSAAPSSSSSSTTNKNSSSSSTTNKNFGPTAPSGTVNGKAITVEWTGDSSADRYYAKVVDQRSKSAVFGSVVYPNRACQSLRCKLNIGDLRSGQYNFLVRPVYGSKSGSYKQISFKVN